MSTHPTAAPSRLTAMVRHTPPTGRRRSIAFLAVVACLGGFLFGYDTGVISGALPYMMMPGEAGGLGLNSVEEGLVGGFLLAGCAVGAVVGGRLSDRYGRRHNILLLAVVFFIGALGCALSWHIAVLYVFRFVLGLAVGGASTTVPVYLSESAPREARGSLVAVDQLMIVTGQFAAFVMNAIIASSQGGPSAVVEDDPSGTYASGSTQTWDALSGIAGLTISDGNGHAWRWMLVLCSVPAIGLWLGIRMMPESARWYVSQGRIREAIGSLKRLRTEGRHDVAAELAEMVEVHEEEKHRETLSLRRAVRIPWLRSIIVFGGIFAMLQQLTGVNTMMYYAPQVLMAAGFSSQASIILNVFTGIASVIGSGLGLLALRRFGRRQVLLVGQVLLTVSLIAMTVIFLIGINPYMDAGGAVSSEVPGFVPYLVVVVIVLFMLGMQSGPGPVMWVMLSEIFPGAVRGAANGFTVMILWITNMIITFVFPTIMSGLGPVTTYALFALVNVGAVIWYFLRIPETRTYTLEEIEQTFREAGGVKRLR
ncbi:MFS transporter [Brachybacterium endophyticum]|uniref:MFS transporter n=1 Tax=Brachybacterium endophyticum TaxID=2182385 RepID=A0A2U2RL26_9MICO|nr:MFS transporter [Brachybacterium endophyticum]PWH06579.1 MFS transporter [Brachybacterium endophyticum]